MLPRFRLWAALGAAFTAAAVVQARPFTLLVYNVENLHDTDGIAVYDDYLPTVYSRSHALTKSRNIARVVAQFEAGRGPDVILFQEIEVDRTPSGQTFDAAAFLARYAGTTLEAMMGADFSPEIGDLPAEALLLKAFADQKLTGYTVVAGDDPADRPHEDGNPRAIKNVVFTRFPVLASRTHPTQTSRHILEVTLDVDGQPLTVFNNHWKSGASDPKTESIRIANATTLRTRLDELLKADPNADIVIGGDLNSQYNQKRRYRAMKQTAINDVLGSQGSELAIRGPARDLYNLWFELPATERGSDTYRGEWGTLMNLIVARGLYDLRGVQYVDNSFGVGKFAGLNADATGLPVRWSGEAPAGRGFSDHFPIYARFTTVKDNQPGKFMPLTRTAGGDDAESVQPNKIDFAQVDVTKNALTETALPVDADLRDGTYTGKIFRVDGPAPEDKFLKVEFRGQIYEVYSPEKEIRDVLFEQRKATQRLKFYGELGQFKGRWQFVVKSAEWIK